MKILHFPTNIGGQAALLSRAERRLGHSSDVVVVGPHQRDASEIDRHFPVDGSVPVRDMISRSVFGYRAPFRYDVLHAYFGRSLLDFQGVPGGRHHLFNELRLARHLGKPVFLTFQGCDIRLAGRTQAEEGQSACMPGRCDLFDDCLRRHDGERLAMMESLKPLADRVFFLNPDLRRSWPDGEFLPYALNGAEHRINLPRTDGPIRILHAPTSSSMKGTPAIVAAVESLKSEFDIDFEIVHRMPHGDALKHFDSFDLAIDQCYLGWYGALSVELMARGKPVMAYVRNTDRKAIAPEMGNEIPVMDLRPDHLAEDIRQALLRRAEWPEIGRQGARFVRRWHDAQAIAGALSVCYADPRAKLDIAAFIRSDAVIEAEISRLTA